MNNYEHKGLWKLVCDPKHLIPKPQALIWTWSSTRFCNMARICAVLANCSDVGQEGIKSSSVELGSRLYASHSGSYTPTLANYVFTDFALCKEALLCCKMFVSLTSSKGKTFYTFLFPILLKVHVVYKLIKEWTQQINNLTIA